MITNGRGKLAGNIWNVLLETSAADGNIYAVPLW